MSDGSNFTMFPLWANMNFTQNCTLYGNWLSTFVQDNPWEPDMTLDGSAWLIVNYFESALPDNYTFPGDGTWGKYYGTILDWYGWNLYNYVDENETGIWMTDQFYDNVLMGPSEVCRPQYCMALGFTGNMDLTGIGVFVAYYAEAILATIYLVAFTLGYTRRHLPDSQQSPYPTHATQLSPEIYHTRGKGLHLSRRAMNAFRGSLNVFLNATMLFSLVMLSAALYISARRTVEHKSWLQSSRPIPSGSALYDLVLSLLASTFSVFPVTMLYAIQRRRDDRGALLLRAAGDHQVWIRRAVLAVLWCLTAAEVYISPRGEYDYEERHDYQDERELVHANCDQRDGMLYWHGMMAAQVLVIGAPLLWLVLTLFVLTGFRIPGVADRPWVSRWRAAWRLVVAWVNVLFMWGLLAYFTVLRHRINVTAGHLDSEDQWTFGQILALATWAPVVVEFAYIFIWGIKEGLERNLPSGFIVKQVPPDTPTPDYGGPGLDNSSKAKEPLMTIQSVPMYSPPLTPPDATTTVELTGPPQTHSYTTIAGDPAQVYTAYEPQYYQSPPLNYYRPQQQVWDPWQSSGW